MEYTPLVFTLLPEYFTLSKLQKVYEVILDKKLLKANFRRKIAPMVKKIDIIQKSGYRPASYFTFNEAWQYTFVEEQIKKLPNKAIYDLGGFLYVDKNKGNS